ncbi:MAG: hypothetical protein V7765_11615 [Oleispira sp.]
MNPIKIASLSLLTLAVVACGGGGSPTNSSTTGETGTTTTTDDGTVVSTGTVVGTPDIGSGTGSSYSDGVITIANGGLVSGKLAAGGQVNITVDVVDRDASDARVSGVEYGVVFGSTCAGTDPARASFDNPEVVTTSGTVTTTYRAEGCSGEDLVTASLYNSAAGTIDKTTKLGVATVTIEVVAPTVNDISYVGASETSLGVASVGNPDLKQVSILTFAVTDVNGDPIPNQGVNFSFSSASASATLATTSEITDSSGEVTVVMNAGPIHTSVRVIASTDFTNGAGEADTVFVSSAPISVSTGYPVQSKMTLALDSFNPHAWGFVGNTVSVSVFLADRWGNPPPDATVVNFTTEGGKIESLCETSGGTCSVVWLGQDRLPGDASNTSNGLYVNDRAGFSTITAYTQGESDYVDVNNNGVFDSTESFITYGEVFEDFDFNGVKDASEELLADTDNNGVHTAQVDVTKYQGSLCSAAAVALGHCATNMHISKSTRLVMASEVASVTLYEFSGGTYSVAAGLTVGSSYVVVIQDVNGNIPNDGTALSFAADGFEVTGKGGDVGKSGIGTLSGTGLPPYGKAFNVRVEDKDPADNPGAPQAGLNELKVTISPKIISPYDVSFGITL